MRIYNSKNVEEIIRNWCQDEGIFRIKHKGDELAKINQFIFDLDFPYNHPRPVRIQVFVPKGKDFVVILCSTKISTNHINILKNNKKVVQQFINEFIDRMYLIQVEFNLRNAKTHPDAWALSTRIFFDGLSKNEFYKGIKKVYNSHMIGNFILNKACMTEKGTDLKKMSDKSFDIPFYG